MKRDRTPDYQRGNEQAAQIILATPKLYGAGLVQWARAWQAAHPPKVRRWEKPPVATPDGPQLRLFTEASAK